MREVAAQVREYVAYCADARAELEAHGGRLDPHHHPTADGAVKMIPHGSDRARADVIRRAFSELTSEVAEPGAGIPQAELEIGA